MKINQKHKQAINIILGLSGLIIMYVLKTNGYYVEDFLYGIYCGALVSYIAVVFAVNLEIRKKEE